MQQEWIWKTDYAADKDALARQLNEMRGKGFAPHFILMAHDDTFTVVYFSMRTS